MNYLNFSLLDWENLAQRTALNPNMIVNLQLISNEGVDSPYLCVFISSDESLHFLCEILDSDNDMEINDPNVAGLEIKVLKNHFILGRERQSYFDIRCNGIHHKEEFTYMIKEICDLIFNKNVSCSKAILTVIRRSTSFWGRPKHFLLNEEQQRGLFGELFAINELVKLGRTDAVLNWKGPLKYKHDFYFNKFSLEVKTTLSSRHKHVINGLEQLEPENERELLILSLRLSESSEGISISDLVYQIKNQLIDYPDIIEDFNSLLIESGFNNLHEEFYSVYFVENHALYPVNSEFPMLTNDSLITPVHSRINKINYTIDMDGLFSFQLTDQRMNEYLSN